MSVPPLPDLILYGRPGCGLCDEARVMLHTLLQDRLDRGLPVPEIVERDIDADEELHRAYFATIPVIEFGARRLEAVTSLAKVRRLLDEVIDGVPETAAR
jgi:hypothetical protein